MSTGFKTITCANKNYCPCEPSLRTPANPVYFEEEQWRALLMRTNRDPAPWTGPEPALGEAMRMVAKLGGYLGRKSDGPPGAEVLWRGLQHLDDITEAWIIMSGFQRPPVVGGVQYG